VWWLTGPMMDRVLLALAAASLAVALIALAIFLITQ
jgi:hypothetical protein